jgi:hypothetical protein
MVLRRYVSRTLGAEPAVARLLLARARARHGRRFVPYAALFVLVTARPSAAVLPLRVRARFVHRFVEPMLDSAPAGLAYVTGHGVHLREPCEGLLP